jgi:hypothetical protein
MAAFQSAKYSQPKPMRGDGTAVCFTDLATVSTAPASSDTIDFVLPAGAELHQLAFDCSDMDTNGTPTIVFRAGYRKLNSSDTLTADDDYFAAAGQTAAQSGALLTCRFTPIKFDVDVIIGLTVNTAAATFAAGTVRMNAVYNQVGCK